MSFCASFGNKNKNSSAFLIFLVNRHIAYNIPKPDGRWSDFQTIEISRFCSIDTQKKGMINLKSNKLTSCATNQFLPNYLLTRENSK